MPIAPSATPWTVEWTPLVLVIPNLDFSQPLPLNFTNLALAISIGANLVKSTHCFHKAPKVKWCPKLWLRRQHIERWFALFQQWKVFGYFDLIFPLRDLLVTTVSNLLSLHINPLSYITIKYAKLLCQDHEPLSWFTKRMVVPTNKLRE